MHEARNKTRNDVAQQRRKDAKQKGRGRALPVIVLYVFGVLVASVARFALLVAFKKLDVSREKHRKATKATKATRFL